ncbi:MAG TPA: hypothetical protein VHP37_01315 [Burkholderiales bacterium]|nr:hypothetical protein [Burkholderiales bacterium]
MKKPSTTRAGIPGHVIALSALAALAAVFAYSLYERGDPSRTFKPETPRFSDLSRVDAESWRLSQQRVLGTGRFSVDASLPAADFTAERPVTRTVTHVGIAPRRAETPRWTPRAASNAYTGPTLASLPPPGD